MRHLLIILNLFSLTLSNSFDVLYQTDKEIAGFQFNLTGIKGNVVSASGGTASANGFTVSTGGKTVLGFSLTGSTIPVGSGTLVTVDVGNADISDVCITDLVLSNASGTAIDYNLDCRSFIIGDTGPNITNIGDIGKKKSKHQKTKTEKDKNNYNNLTEVITEASNGKTIIDYYDHNQKLVKKIEYNQNKQIVYEEVYKNGIVDVIIMNSYHKNGQLALKLYSDSHSSPYVIVTYFHENGQLAMEGQTSGGVKVGLWIGYDKNGKPIGSETYPDHTK